MLKIEKLSIYSPNKSRSNYYNKLSFNSKHIIDDNVLFSDKNKELSTIRNWFYMMNIDKKEFYKQKILTCSYYWLSHMDIAISKIYKQYFNKYIVSVGYKSNEKDCQLGFSGTGEYKESSFDCALREMREETGLAPIKKKYLNRIHYVNRNREVSYYTIDIRNVKKINKRNVKNINKKNINKKNINKNNGKPLKIVVFIIGNKEDIRNKLLNISLYENKDNIGYISAIPVTHITKIADITKKRSNYCYKHNIKNSVFQFEITD
jgi:hypothetical protein